MEPPPLGVADLILLKNFAIMIMKESELQCLIWVIFFSWIAMIMKMMKAVVQKKTVLRGKMKHTKQKMMMKNKIVP